MTKKIKPVSAGFKFQLINSMDKKVNDGYIVRFNLIERIQHIVLFVSLIMLLLTGLSLAYYDSWFGKFMIGLEGGLQGRGKLHNLFAFVLIALGIFHAFYVTFSDKGHREISFLKYRKKDFKNLVLSFKYNFGLSKEKPRFGRYNLAQKFQYWGVIFGCAIMIITGIILLLKVWDIAMIFPKWLWDITNLVHSYEGMLIFLVLFVWHIYDVHLSPGVFPMSNIWLSGKISKQELKEEHPAEYEEILGEEVSAEKK
jgi:formate dehydrogenase gamma subunit